MTGWHLPAACLLALALLAGAAAPSAVRAQCEAAAGPDDTASGAGAPATPDVGDGFSPDNAPGPLAATASAHATPGAGSAPAAGEPDAAGSVTWPASDVVVPAPSLPVQQELAAVCGDFSRAWEVEVRARVAALAGQETALGQRLDGETLDPAQRQELLAEQERVASEAARWRGILLAVGQARTALDAERRELAAQLAALASDGAPLATASAGAADASSPVLLPPATASTTP